MSLKLNNRSFRWLGYRNRTLLSLHRKAESSFHNIRVLSSSPHLHKFRDLKDKNNHQVSFSINKNTKADDYFGLKEYMTIKYQDKDQSVPENTSSINAEERVRMRKLKHEKRKLERKIKAPSLKIFESKLFSAAEKKRMHIQFLESAVQTNFGYISVDADKKFSSIDDKNLETVKLWSKTNSGTEFNPPSKTDFSINGGDIINKSNVTNESSNYFDECFFPDHSVDKSRSYSEENYPASVEANRNLNESFQDKSISSNSSGTEHSNYVDAQYFPSFANTAKTENERENINYIDGQYFSKDQDDNSQSGSFISVAEKYLDTNLQSDENRNNYTVEEIKSSTTSKNIESEEIKFRNKKTEALCMNLDFEDSTTLDNVSQEKQPTKKIKQLESFESNADNLNQDLSNEFKSLIGSDDKTTQKISSSFIQGKHLSAKDHKSALKKHFENVERETVSNDSVHCKDFVESHKKNQQIKDDSALGYALKVRKSLKLRISDETPEISLPKRRTRAQQADPSLEDNDTPESISRKYKLDSLGFRILKNQAPDLNHSPTADVVRMLKSRVIFHIDDFLAVDKPYGLTCFPQEGERLNLTDLLPLLCKVLGDKCQSESLHLVQGMDRDVTGPVLLAKSPELAYILKGMYNNREIIQRFWAVTKGVPNPKAGIVDIPIGQNKIGGIYKTVIKPRLLTTNKYLRRMATGKSMKAETEYKVVAQSLKSAIVQCEPYTVGAKHQIRVHLASGLNTPILGDHKYSHYSKQSPQKLHPEILKGLKIRQATARYLNLHLHCRSLVMPNYKGKMYFITARAPLFFKDNVESLNMKLPE